MKDSGQDIYQSLYHNTPVVSRNMGTVKLVWHILTSICVCNAVYIKDDKSDILSPYEIDGIVHELKLPPIKISINQPFPLNNLDNCNRNAEKGPLQSLSGGLLSTLLSVLSKSNKFHSTGGRYSEDNCVDNKQINPSDQVSGGEIGNDLGRDDEKTKSNGPLITADIDVLNRGYEKNYPNEQTSESDGSLINADIDVLHGDNEENYPIERTTDSNGSIVDADVDVLSEGSEEKKSNEQPTESDGSLVNADVDVLSKCHGENSADGYSTESGISSTDNDENLSKDENKADDYSSESIRSSKIDDIDDLSKNNDENNSNEQTTESGGALVDADVDVLTSKEPPLTDAVGGILKREVFSADYFKNLKKIDFINEYTQDELEKGNLAMVDNNKKYLANLHNVERENLLFNPVNEKSEHQISHESENKDYNQHDPERGERSIHSHGTYRKASPMMSRHHLFPGRPVTKIMPLDWNIQSGYIQYFVPEGNIFRERAFASTRMFPLRIVTQGGYPLMTELPQSVASSSLYGSYASTGMVPANRFGCTGQGVIGGSETSQTGSETTLESSETTVESSETTV